MNKFTFVFEEKNGFERICTINSMHLNGAVRKLYQEYDVDHIVQIL